MREVAGSNPVVPTISYRTNGCRSGSRFCVMINEVSCEGFRGVRLKWIWDDIDVVESECSVDVGDFRGKATCYAAWNEHETFASQLTTFLQTHDGRVLFSTGLEGDTKAVVLEVFPVDAAKHLAIMVHLATDNNTAEEASRLDHRFAVEPWALELFSRQLRGMRKVGDEAVLLLEPTS